MKALVTKDFRFAVGGNHVIDVKPGTVVEGRCAEVAVAEKWGEPLDEQPPAERRVMRLPLLEEYVEHGYDAKTYEEWLKNAKTQAERDGIAVEVRALTSEERKGHAAPASDGQGAPVVDQKALEVAPENKAVAKAPKNKSR